MQDADDEEESFTNSLNQEDLVSILSNYIQLKVRPFPAATKHDK
jgi:hypothetical protein